LHIFGKKKEVLHCAACSRELGRHKYRANEEWNIDGFLCGNCHIEKTKEFMAARAAMRDKCGICKTEIASHADKYKTRWQWNLEAGTRLCKSCYDKKEAEYDKKLNFCSLCNAKLGLFRYNPKPAWHVEGQLCRQCWDNRNTKR
jgi:hypothetical protein